MFSILEIVTLCHYFYFYGCSLMYSKNFTYIYIMFQSKPFLSMPISVCSLHVYPHVGLM